MYYDLNVTSSKWQLKLSVKCNKGHVGFSLPYLLLSNMFTKIIFRLETFCTVSSFSFIVSIVEVQNTTTIKSKATTEDSKHQKTKQATKDHKNAIIKSTKKQVQNENIGQVRDTENQDYMDQENQDYMDNGVAPLSIQGSQNPTSDNSNDIVQNKFKNS